MIKLNEKYEFLEKRTRRINPTIPIPEQASSVHGITDDMVKDEPTFQQVAKAVLDFITGCDIIGYNSIGYDVPLLFNELERAGLIWDYQGVNFIDVCNIFKIKEPRTLTAAVKFYCDRDHEDAHGAESDVVATIKVLDVQLRKYGLEDLTMGELAKLSNFDKPILDVAGKFTTDADGDIIFNFGVHKGKKAKSEQSYLNWMLKSNFSSDTKRIIRTI